MNKLFLVLIILLMAPAIAAYTTIDGTSGITSPSGTLYVTAINSDPSPAVPGDYVDVWVKVENRGQSEVPDAFINVLNEAPFTALGESEQHLGKLSAGQAAVAHFQVKVDSGAPSGASPLKFELRKYQAETPQIGEVQLQVSRLDAVLAIDHVTTTPATVAQGEIVRIGVTLTNKADTSLRSVRASLRLLTQVTTTAGLSTAELPFTPVGGGVEQTVDNIAPGQSKEIVFTLVVDPDASNKPYKIPLSIVYYDPTGANRTLSEVVGVIVGSEPELSVYLDSSEITSAVSTGNVIVRFVNHGVSDVRFLTARLNPTNEYTIVSSPETYVGKIDSDDYETAEFKIALTGKAGSTVQLPIVMEYRDGNNNKYSNGVSLALVRHTSKELGTSGVGAGTVIIMIVVLGVIVWFAWKKKWFRKR